MVFKSDHWKYFRYKMEERYERLGIQAWINRNPKTVIAIAAGSVFLFLVMAFIQLIPDRPERHREPEKVWFID